MAATWVEADPSITAACDDESTRYALGGVEMRNHPTEPDRVVVAATDSRCLAVGVMDGHVECGDSIIVPKSIMPKSKAEQSKVSKSIGEHKKRVHYEADRKKWEAPAYDRTADPVEGRFPNYPDVLPQVHGGFLSLSIDPRILYDLATAVGCGVDDNRSLELLIDVEAVERYVRNQLPDESSFRDDVKAHVLAHATKADGSQLVLAVDPSGNIVTIDDEKRMAHATQLDWIVVDHLPADATVLEWQDEMWRKVVARTRLECGHVRNAIAVVGHHGRIGAIMPLAPERNRQTTGAEVYEAVRKLAAEACRPKRTNEELPVPEIPSPASEPTQQEAFRGDGEESDPDDEPESDGGDDRNDPTSCEYGETHGNDMNLDSETDHFDPPVEYAPDSAGESQSAPVDPMAALMALVTG